VSAASAGAGGGSDGRERVLAQIRQSLGRGSATADTTIVPLAGQGPRPAYDGDVVEHFVAKMQEKAATVERLGTIADVGPAVARFIAAMGAPPRVRASRALTGSEWPIEWPSGIEVVHGAAVREDSTSVTPCFAAVAESGGIVTLSGPDTPSTLNFVPDNHVVVVRASQVLRHFEDAWALLRGRGQPMPRTVNVISGPSRTADIEQTIQLGAHGPRRLHVLLLRG
jgi:L-lactate dehydrogenase complex protein LldG